MLSSLKQCQIRQAVSWPLIVINCYYYVLLMAPNGTLFLSNGFIFFFWHTSLFTNIIMFSYQN